MQLSLRTARCLLPAAFFAACTLLAPRVGLAQTVCQELPDDEYPNKIYGVGGSAATPLISSIAREFAKLPGDQRVTIIWHDPGAGHAMHSLIGQEVDGVRTPAPVGTSGAVQQARYWDSNGNEHRCSVDTLSNPVLADFGYMAAPPQDINGYEDLDIATFGIGAFVGPVSGWSLITHIDSNQNAISAEALYLVYGYADNSGVAPWTQKRWLFGRNYTSAALLAWVAATGLPAESFQFHEDVQTNSAMVTAVANAEVPNASLGFVSTEVADRNRGQVKTLAFQAKGQTCAYYPDSTPTSFDKKNIRDGHYWNWAYHIFYAPVNGSGVPSNPLVARFFDAITGKTNPDVPHNLDLIIDEGTIPDCAMRVSRDPLGGYTPLASYAPEEPCGCYFDFVATGESTCDECATTEDCSGDQVCRRGFCEEW